MTPAQLTAMPNAPSVGGGGSMPIGTIVAGAIRDPSWLPLDNGVYNKADYPLLDTSKMLTFGSNAATQPQIFTASGYNVFWMGGTNWYAANISLSNTTAYKSTDDGVTWVSAPLPLTGDAGKVVTANGVLFYLLNSASASLYTSTDNGSTWVNRAVDASMYWGGVAYLENRYILLPRYAPPTVVNILWSTNLTTWTLVYIGAIGGPSSSNYAAQQKGAAYSPNTGLMCSFGSQNIVFWSPDGLSWRASGLPYAFNGSSWSTETAQSGSVGVTDSGDLWSGTTIITGTSTYSAYRTDGFIGYAPVGSTNIVIGNHGEISENRGKTVHIKAAVTGTMFDFTVDISPTTMIQVSLSGYVYRRLIDTTKFRAIAPMTSNLMGLQNMQKLYIKAR